MAINISLKSNDSIIIIEIALKIQSTEKGKQKNSKLVLNKKLKNCNCDSFFKRKNYQQIVEAQPIVSASYMRKCT